MPTDPTTSYSTKTYIQIKRKVKKQIEYRSWIKYKPLPNHQGKHTIVMTSKMRCFQIQLLKILI